MDAVSFDYMLPEYQERRQDAEEYIAQHKDEKQDISLSEDNSDDRLQSAIGSSDEQYEEKVGGGSTVPASEVDLVEAVSNLPAGNGSKGSSGDSYRDNSSRGHASIYSPSSISPTVNYERESPRQKLVAVFGREFDMPDRVATSFQRLVAETRAATDALESPIKFVPFTLKRTALLKGTFDTSELMKHDLLCMCYNASEARIMLTGADGFYSSLLRHSEATLGTNKVAFLISNFRHSTSVHSNLVVSPSLKTRLYKQEALKVYLDNNQVLSWVDDPSSLHLEQLRRLTELERNPQSLFNQSCVCL